MCSIKGCTKPVVARSLCNAHYKRWRKYGDPETMLHAPHATKGEPSSYLLEHMYDGCYDVNPWPYATRKGYPVVGDSDGRLRGGHRIVCEMVNGPPEAGQQARHKCGKGHLGCFNAECLEWGSRKDNSQDSIKHGTWVHGETCGTTVVSTKDVERMREMYSTRRYNERELSKMFGISQAQVSNIVNNKQRNNG